VVKASSLLTRDHLVDDAGVEHARHEAGAKALNLVRAGLAAGEHRRRGRLDRDGLEAGLARLDHLRHAGDRAAGAHADTRISTWPSVSFQISSAVVRDGWPGWPGSSNCCGMK
jgi:hypothetical protein